MDTTFGLRCVLGLVIGAILGVAFGIAIGEIPLGIMFGAFGGAFTGWFIAAVVAERKKAETKMGSQWSQWDGMPLQPKKRGPTMATQSVDTDRTQLTCQLPDGRVLGYAEYGDPQGKPLFYFHGWPSSRIEFSGLNGNALATQLGVRVIALDRPGFGFSSFQSRHRFIDWPQDVGRLADRLGLASFAVMSYSAGSP